LQASNGQTHLIDDGVEEIITGVTTMSPAWRALF
jgi:hypothetical protein